MTSEERAELDALRARVAELEELAKHQAALSIVLYNGLHQLGTLTLDLSLATRPGYALPMEERAELMQKVETGLREMSAIISDLYNRLEPIRGHVFHAS